MANTIMATTFFVIIFGMIIVSTTTTTNTNDVFSDGIYTVVNQKVATRDASKPPAPLFLAYPIVDGAAEFGVLLLLHGYMLRNTFYSQLMQHVSSYGFIVVAPQLYEIGTDATNDVTIAANVTAWLADGGLQKVLPPTVIADLTGRFALAGHSRGGKAAFALALRIAASSSLPISALIGIDPVDGTTWGQTNPGVVSSEAGAVFSGLNHTPVMVIGSGLKGVIRDCTPNGLSHEAFYRECEKPACYFVARRYGHMDMLDDETPGPIGWMSYVICKSGRSREPMRRFVGGVSVAFLKAFLEKDDADFMAIKEGKAQFPVLLNKVDFRM